LANCSWRKNPTSVITSETLGRRLSEVGNHESMPLWGFAICLDFDVISRLGDTPWALRSRISKLRPKDGILEHLILVQLLGLLWKKIDVLLLSLLEPR
jgi:hypothetical protein